MAIRAITSRAGRREGGWLVGAEGSGQWVVGGEGSPNPSVIIVGNEERSVAVGEKWSSGN